jgi:tetratricopeptide (TPR) repeat protein
MRNTKPMKTKILASTLLTLGVIFAFAAIRPVGVMFATPNGFPPRYTLIDLGTFGGPNSYFNGAPPAMINSAGVAAGAADTSTACSLRDAYQRARAYTERALAEQPQSAFVQLALAEVMAGIGERDEAMRLCAHAMEMLPVSRDALMGRTVLVDSATIYGMLGDADRAIPLIERSLAIPSFQHRQLLRPDPKFDSIRSDPRFQRLIAEPAAGD